MIKVFKLEDTNMECMVEECMEDATHSIQTDQTENYSLEVCKIHLEEIVDRIMEFLNAL